MSKKKISVLVFSTLVLFVFASLNINAAEIKQVQKTIIKPPEKVKVTKVIMAEIQWTSQDEGIGQVIEVNGKRFGEPQGTKKIFLGQNEAIVQRWYDSLIIINFPESPILGRQIPLFIKNNNTIISNTKNIKLYTFLYSSTPKRAFTGLLAKTILRLEASWCGTNKNNVNVRFTKRRLITNPIGKPQLGKILSLTRHGMINTLEVKPPPTLTPGTYQISIVQNNKIVSRVDDPVTLEVLKRIPIK